MSYKENILIAHTHAHRNTCQNAKADKRDTVWLRANRKVVNAKTRPVVRARLKKLTRYVRIAWNGYSFGKLYPKIENANDSQHPISR